MPVGGEGGGIRKHEEDEENKTTTTTTTEGTLPAGLVVSTGSAMSTAARCSAPKCELTTVGTRSEHGEREAANGSSNNHQANNKAEDVSSKEYDEEDEEPLSEELCEYDEDQRSKLDLQLDCSVPPDRRRRGEDVSEEDRRRFATTEDVEDVCDDEGGLKQRGSSRELVKSCRATVAVPVVVEGEDEEEGKTGGDGTEVIVAEAESELAEKCLFYTTAFFILLAVFSLLAFLFLVPFVIDPAFTTIFMDFDPEPALCLTVSTVTLEGLKNCTWTSCREGCTREVFLCTQIRVNYRAARRAGGTESSSKYAPDPGGGFGLLSSSRDMLGYLNLRNNNNNNHLSTNNHYSNSYRSMKQRSRHKLTSSSSSWPSSSARRQDSTWDFEDAHLYPNVKGCGYPPHVVCSDFLEKYAVVGANFSCHYSKVDRALVVTSYDMSNVILNLIYSMAIPIPSFIISVAYLIFAYFRIYSSNSVRVRAREAVAAAAAAVAAAAASSNNNNGQGSAPALDSHSESPSQTPLTLENINKVTRSSSSKTQLNSLLLSDKLKPVQQVIEMNDLNPNANSSSTDLLIPNNRRHHHVSDNSERINGSTNSHPFHTTANVTAKNKG